MISLALGVWLALSLPTAVLYLLSSVPGLEDLWPPGPSPQERAYRRMPPADEVMAAYRQVGSISGLAERFNVPRYTAQGWARQLRKQGHAIGRAT